MELIKDLWHGDIPLSKDFWLFGVCVSVLFKVIFFFLTFQRQIFSITIGQIFLWCMIIFGAIYSPFIFISIWRSANKYKGLSRYPTMAKFVVIFFGWGGYIRDLIEMGKLLLD